MAIVSKCANNIPFSQVLHGLREVGPDRRRIIGLKQKDSWLSAWMPIEPLSWKPSYV